jgi:hypothetical protein
MRNDGGFLQTSEDWKKMIGGAEGPCISILQHVRPLLSRSTPRPVRLKKALESLDPALDGRRLDPEERRRLLEPLYELEASGENGEEAREGSTLVIFRSPRVFQRFYVPQSLDESVTVADHFYILPLLPLVGAGRVFYILALSQQNIRLIRCGPDGAEEAPLPEWAPRTLDESAQTEPPDSSLDNRSSAGPSLGAMKGVMFGHASVKKDEYLAQFYREVDQALNELLKTEQATVVLAGVDYELALYRRVSNYPQLAPDGVRGAPDALKGAELFRRAQELADAHFAAPLDQALKAYDKLGPERRSSDWKQAVTAAYEGRVAHLFLAQGAREMGVFDAASHTVEQHPDPQPGDEDLANAAAVETLLHGGLVDILPPDKAPGGAAIAALLRY